MCLGSTVGCISSNIHHPAVAMDQGGVVAPMIGDVYVLPSLFEVDLVAMCGQQHLVEERGGVLATSYRGYFPFITLACSHQGP